MDDDDICVVTKEEVDAEDRKHIAKVVGVPEVDISDEALHELKYGPHDQAVRELWAKKAWLKQDK